MLIFEKQTLLKQISKILILSNSLFSNTNLTKAKFSGAINYDININRNKVEKASFSRHEAVRLLDALGINLVD